MKKVLVYGVYDADNLGDDYMMYCVDNILTKNGINPLYINYDNKKNYFSGLNVNYIEIPMYKRYKSKVQKLKKIIKWYFFDKMNQISALIFMGGGYTNQSFGFGNLIRILIMCKKAQKENKKIYFFGQTAGPVNKKIFKIVLKKIYSLADNIYVREKFSYELLKELGIHSELIGDDAYLCVDVKEYTEKKHVIFNYKDFEGYEEYKKDYFEMLLKIAKKIGKKVLVIPFRSEATSKEYIYNKELYEYLKNNSIDVEFTIERNIDSFRKILNESELVIGTAYHSIVLGLIYNNSVMSLYNGEYYKRKIEGILEWYNCENNCFDIKEIKNEIFVENKLELIKKLILNQEKITKKIGSNVVDAWTNVIEKIKEEG